MRFAFLAALALLAGCVSVNPEPPTPTSAVGKDLALQGATLHVEANAAGLSKLQVAQGKDVSLTLPDGVLVQDAKGVLRPAKNPVQIHAGETLTFLPPWNATGLAFEADAGAGKTPLDLSFEEGHRLVSGDLAVELLKVQREKFPHRTPGMPNYPKAEAYFADFFKALNYTVQTNAYGSEVTIPLSDKPGPQSAESVLGIKRGTTKADRYLVFGGHFDVVEQTTEGAFDNTAGAIATLAMAKAFANVTTEHSIIFAEWGGEEDGIVGSQAWLTTHPDMVPKIDGYVNFDVVALAWPAPKPSPAPIVVTAGPDGPIADALHAQAAMLEKTYVRSGAKLVMENWAKEQATGTAGQGGAGVNAQSDHTPFAMRGIPSWFLFTSRVSDVFTIIHSPKDTTENMTKYSLKGVEGIGQEFTPEEMKEGEALLARSFEAQMAPMFAWVVLTDTGALPSAIPSPGASLLEGSPQVS